jgi:hypothetical protein
MEIQTGVTSVRMDRISDLYRVNLIDCGPGSVVAIATAYVLDGPVIESRWEIKE